MIDLLKFFLSSEIVEPPYVANPTKDPLTHPDVARMSLTELADLPFLPQPRARPVEPRVSDRCA